MHRFWKILLYCYSAYPLFWGLLTLFSVHFNWFSGIRRMDDYLLIAGALYAFYGIGIYLLLVILGLLRWRKKISWKEFFGHIGLTGLGVLFVWWMVKYDIWGVVNTLID